VQTRAIAHAARELGMSPTSYAILVEVAHDGWVTNGQIARRLAMSTGGVTPALDRLEHQGLVERRPNPADRRSSIVSVSERGHEALHRLADAVGRHLEGFVGELDETARDVVLTFLLAAHDAHEAVIPAQA
jgi:DNA-binding MarR family transcriptional regulator